MFTNFNFTDFTPISGTEPDECENIWDPTWGRTPTFSSVSLSLPGNGDEVNQYDPRHKLPAQWRLAARLGVIPSIDTLHARIPGLSVSDLIFLVEQLYMCKLAALYRNPPMYLRDDLSIIPQAFKSQETDCATIFWDATWGPVPRFPESAFNYPGNGTDRNIFNRAHRLPKNWKDIAYAAVHPRTGELIRRAGGQLTAEEVKILIQAIYMCELARRYSKSDKDMDDHRLIPSAAKTFASIGNGLFVETKSRCDCGYDCGGECQDAYNGPAPEQIWPSEAYPNNCGEGYFDEPGSGYTASGPSDGPVGYNFGHVPQQSQGQFICTPIDGGNGMMQHGFDPNGTGAQFSQLNQNVDPITGQPYITPGYPYNPYGSTSDGGRSVQIPGTFYPPDPYSGDTAPTTPTPPTNGGGNVSNPFPPPNGGNQTATPPAGGQLGYDPTTGLYTWVDFPNGPIPGYPATPQNNGYNGLTYPWWNSPYVVPPYSPVWRNTYINPIDPVQPYDPTERWPTPDYFTQRDPDTNWPSNFSDTIGQPDYRILRWLLWKQKADGTPLDPSNPSDDYWWYWESVWYANGTTTWSWVAPDGTRRSLSQMTTEFLTTYLQHLTAPNRRPRLQWLIDAINAELARRSAAGAPAPTQAYSDPNTQSQPAYPQSQQAYKHNDWEKPAGSNNHDPRFEWELTPGFIRHPQPDDMPLTPGEDLEYYGPIPRAQVRQGPKTVNKLFVQTPEGFVPLSRLPNLASRVHAQQGAFKGRLTGVKPGENAHGNEWELGKGGADPERDDSWPINPNPGPGPGPKGSVKRKVTLYISTNLGFVPYKTIII